MLWAEAKIIDCDLAKQKIRVHFIGWGKSHDIWTDTVSIAKHGRYARTSRSPRAVCMYRSPLSLTVLVVAASAKANTTPSWDGDMHLFEDMLGPIDASTPCHDSVHGGVAGIANVAPAPPSAKRSVDAPVDRKASRSHKRKIVAEQPTKPSASRKRAKPTPTPAPAPAKAAFRKKVRRSVSALPEVAKVEPLTVDADTEERKQLIIDEMAQAAAFLEQCAGAWKRQLAEMRLEGKL